MRSWFTDLALHWLATPAVIGALGLWIGGAARKALASVSTNNTLKMLETFLDNIAAGYIKAGKSNVSAASIQGEVWIQAEKRIPDTLADLPQLTEPMLAKKVVEKIGVAEQAAGKITPTYPNNPPVGR